ncbi:MAG: TRAP transporter large permease [Clostridiales bacterium]|nr:TRAP transporter large permease [Clostridiales bacterium]
MTPEAIGFIAIAVVVALIAMRMWIGVAMGLVGFVGIMVMRDLPQALSMSAEVIFSNVNQYTLTVIPMFALMGMIISESRLGADLFGACYAWLGRVRGGLAAATIATSGLLGAVCGSHMVGTVIMSKIALPEMKRYKYDDSFAAAAVCAGAPLSIIIPPSLPLIMYGILTEQNIGRLFMSGVIPGITMIAVFIVIVIFMCTRKPELGPRGDRMEPRAVAKASLGVVPVVVLFAIVLGGIYTNVFTTTESGAMGTAGAIVIALVHKSLNGKKFMLALKETAMVLGMLYALLLGTYIFIRLIAYSRVPFAFSNFLVSLDAPLPVILIALALIYIVLGMLIPEIPMMLLTIPIIFPALMTLGFDPVWIGIYIVLMMALGAVTPPIGMVVFIVSGLSGVSVPKLFKAVVPFIAGDLVVIVLLCIFPAMATYIPSLM